MEPGGDRCPHVVGDDEDGAAVEPAADHFLGEVGLPGEGVGVVHRLLREPEAEEVEGERGRSRSASRKARPVEQGSDGKP